MNTTTKTCYHFKFFIEDPQLPPFLEYNNASLTLSGSAFNDQNIGVYTYTAVGVLKQLSDATVWALDEEPEFREEFTIEVEILRCQVEIFKPWSY